MVVGGWSRCRKVGVWGRVVVQYVLGYPGGGGGQGVLEGRALFLWVKFTNLVKSTRRGS